jgi:hypothetical protein
MELVMLGVGLLLTIGTGLFVASEFALVNLDRADLEARQAAGESRLSLTISALRITSTHLSSAQLGITLTTLLTGYTMEPALTTLLSPVLTAWGFPERWSRRRHDRRDRRRHDVLHDPRRAGAEELRARHPASDREGRHAVPGRVHHGVPPRDHRPERLRQRHPAGDGDRTQGGAVRRPHGGGALEPRPTLRERGPARRGHRVAAGSHPDLRAAHDRMS